MHTHSQRLIDNRDKNPQKEKRTDLGLNILD
jgi:hypothetical protein